MISWRSAELRARRLNVALVLQFTFFFAITHLGAIAQQGVSIEMSNINPEAAGKRYILVRKSNWNALISPSRGPSTTQVP